MKLVKHLANLGYGSRKQVMQLFREGRITDNKGEVIYSDDKIAHGLIYVDGELLDPDFDLILMLNKPVGYTCSTKDAGKLVYELLPPRFRLRSPVLSTVGRLDRNTSGLLLFTDNGQLLHKIISPKSAIPKIYQAVLAEQLRGDEISLFNSGTLLLEGEKTPLLPAKLEILGDKKIQLTLHEGRYHQVRRMFAAVGNHVVDLHRCQVGQLTLGTLQEGNFSILNKEDIDKIF